MKWANAHPRRGPRASIKSPRIISVSARPPAPRHQHSIAAPVRSVSVCFGRPQRGSDRGQAPL
eukprot:13604196-Alexandrium_andersonii.AAC.1